MHNKLYYSTRQILVMNVIYIPYIRLDIVMNVILHSSINKLLILSFTTFRNRPNNIPLTLSYSISFCCDIWIHRSLQKKITMWYWCEERIRLVPMRGECYLTQWDEFLIGYNVGKILLQIRHHFFVYIPISKCIIQIIKIMIHSWMDLVSASIQPISKLSEPPFFISTIFIQNV